MQIRVVALRLRMRAYYKNYNVEVMPGLCKIQVLT